MSLDNAERQIEQLTREQERLLQALSCSQAASKATEAEAEIANSKSIELGNRLNTLQKEVILLQFLLRVHEKIR